MPWLKRILLFLLTVILFRMVVADIYYVPTSSMEGMIPAKSYIMVNKFSYGAKLPRSLREIPWISWLAKTSGFNPSFWKNKRIPSWKPIKRFDVVLAEHNRTKIIKRIVGLPGDNLSITNGKCFINGQQINEPKTVQLTQKIFSMDTDLLRTLKAESCYRWDYQGERTFQVTGSCDYFQQLSQASSLMITPLEKEVIDTTASGLFPMNKNGEWTMNDYGTIRIPKAGERLELTSEHWATYCATIEKHEEVSIDCQQVKHPYVIDGIPTEYYTFKRNYYFLMGDNRMKSFDSRFFGFLPVDLIFGRVDYPN